MAVQTGETRDQGTAQGRVVVLGSMNRDRQLRMPRHPRTGETVLAGDVALGFGGKGANQAVAAAGAGARTFMVGRVGDDEGGHAYVARLARYGVDVSHVRVTSGVPTGEAIVYLDADGDNMIVVSPGANQRVCEADLDILDDLGASDVLLMQLELPCDVVCAAARRAALRGARVIINLAPYAPLPQDVLDLCHPVIVNEHEHELLQAAGARADDLMVTRGARGATWGSLHTPAEPVAAVVDSTGAGDSYCGTLAAHLARGMAEREAMQAAAAAAAVTVGHTGAQPERPPA